MAKSINATGALIDHHLMMVGKLVNNAALCDAILFSAFNHSHVIPPFLGDAPGVRSNMSPYQATISEVIERFTVSPERVVILQGLLRYRAKLRELGFVNGFQWLDGSFVENIEAREYRPPGDVEVVTFSHQPAGMTNAEINAMIQANLAVFDMKLCRDLYHCDAVVVQLNKRPELVVDDTRYWYGLYSHRRDGLWEGMVQVSLLSDDDLAAQRLAANAV